MIALSQRGTWTVIDLHGPLNPAAISALDCVLSDLANDEVGDLAVNLGNVDFLDARHLQTLSQALNRVRQRAHQIVTVSVPTPISSILATWASPPCSHLPHHQRTPPTAKPTHNRTIQSGIARRCRRTAEPIGGQ
jgi:anti-anti-sigma factor